MLPDIERLTEERRTATSDADKARWGQFFTPPVVAWFMAGLLRPRRGGAVRILDPGAGTGILGAAAAMAMLEGGASSVDLVAIEAEPHAARALRESLDALARRLGPSLRVTVLEDDFLDVGQPRLGRPALPADFDIAIGNPPYFKMSPTEPRGSDAPNAYARFMDVAAGLLRPGGELAFIVPRSFMSGLYFKSFRRRLRAAMVLERVHVFESRREAFKDDDVLQENVIVRYRKGGTAPVGVEISSSASPATLAEAKVRVLPRALVELPDDPQRLVLLPATPDQERVVRTVRGWSASLRSMGLRISTGPVVAFRSDAMVVTPNGEPVVPMLWMQHVHPGVVRWPIGEGMRKPEYILATAGPKLLVSNATYVLLRRFSAKEEARRLTAAVLHAGALPGDVIGLENHLNFIHRPGGAIDTEEALGLAALLSSTLVDDYFRVANGNTQVNATDIEGMPFPEAGTIRRLGAAVAEKGEAVLASRERLDELMSALLG